MKYNLILLLLLLYSLDTRAEELLKEVYPVCVNSRHDQSDKMKLLEPTLLPVALHNIIYRSNSSIGGFYFVEIKESEFERYSTICGQLKILKAWVPDLNQMAVYKVVGADGTSFNFSSEISNYQCLSQCRTSYLYFSLFGFIRNIDDEYVKIWNNEVADLYTINIESMGETILTQSINESNLIKINEEATKKIYISYPDHLPTLFTPARLLLRAVLESAYSFSGNELTERELIQKTNFFLPMIGHPRRDRGEDG